MSITATSSLNCHLHLLLHVEGHEHATKCDLSPAVFGALNVCSWSPTTLTRWLSIIWDNITATIQENIQDLIYLHYLTLVWRFLLLFLQLLITIFGLFGIYISLNKNLLHLLYLNLLLLDLYTFIFLSIWNWCFELLLIKKS